MDISRITVGENRRRIDPAKVAELRESIEEIGLINPITVTEAGSLVAGMYYQKYSTEKVFINHCPREWALEIISEDEWNALEELQKR